MTTPTEADQRGRDFGNAILAAVGDWQQNSPRTKQSTSRILGMSEMGGCREYIRATIAGDIKVPPKPLKWPAFVGTALGDMIETILGDYGFATQEDAVVTLPRTGIRVKGHLDARTRNAVIDLKSRDELAEVRRDGPPFKEKAQVSGYLVAKVQEGVLDESATGHLVYLDRSGKIDEAFVWSTTYDNALLILDAVEDRLLQVQNALASGYSQGYLRDEPESWCWAIGCPFYSKCWEGYMPTSDITHERELEMVRKFKEARKERDELIALVKNYRDALRGVEGKTPDGTTVRWSISQYEGGLGDRLDVREPKGS